MAAIKIIIWKSLAWCRSSTLGVKGYKKGKVKRVIGLTIGETG